MRGETTRKVSVVAGWGRKWALVLAAAAFLAGPWAVRLGAQETREAVDRAVREAKESLLRAIEELLRNPEAHKGFVDEIARIVEAREERLKRRIAELEKTLAAKERRIRELEAKLAAGAKEKAGKPAAAKASAPAFLGVGHVAHEKGAYVTAVQPDSPAAKAGIQPGDIIVEVDGKAVSSETLGEAITSHAPGDKVRITVLREGNRRTLEAVLADRNAFFAERARAAAQPEEKKPVFLGIWVVQQPEGVVVDAVDEGHTGHVAGLKKGDRILRINDKPIKTTDEIAGVLKQIAAGEKLKLLVRRGDEVHEIEVVGGADKGQAKLLSHKIRKESAPPAAAEKETEEKKPEPAAAPKPPPFLGVAVVEDEGLIVDSVVPGGPAAKAGVQANDRILQAGGKPVRTTDDLRAALKGLGAGDTLKLRLERNGRELEIEVRLGATPGTEAKETEKTAEKPAQPSGEKKPETAEPPKPKETPRQRGILGITASEIGDDSVLISEVVPGGPADRAGVRPGDILLKVADREIHNFMDLAAALENRFAGDKVVLRVRRGDEEKDIEVTLGKPESEALGD